MPDSLKIRSLALLAAGFLLGFSPAFLAAQSAQPERASERTAQPISQAPGGFRIAGTVVDAISAHPLARAQVSVTNTKNPNDRQVMVTADDGRFRFQVNAGKYSLQGAKRGFITFAYDQHENFWTAIVTGAGLDTEGLTLRLPPAASISGRVLDDVGDPVRNAAIAVFREDHRTGVSRIEQFTNATTDDLGTYEVTPLDAGTYFVAVTAQPWYAVHPVSSQPVAGPASAADRTLDVAFPISYYKDATESDDATPIPIRRGDHAEVDFHLGAVPALHLIVHSPESVMRKFWPQFQKPTFDGMTPAQPSSVELVSPGVYEITGLAAGKYVLHAGGSTDGILKTPSEVYLNSDGQEIDPSGGAATSSVKASVRVRGATKLLPQLALLLRNEKGRVAARAPVDDKGEASFTNIAPGKYDVLAGSFGKAYSVFKISLGSSVIPGHVLNVPAGASLTVSLSLVGAEVTVEGFAKRSGKATPGAMVVLVPSDPESNLELFRRDQSDLDGSFSLAGVVPGNYTILAIENGWDLDWAKPAVIEHYRQHGQKLVVGSETKGSMHLPGPVEVQPKL